MLTISFIAIIVGGIFTVIKLLSIRRHNVVLFELCNFRREIMLYLREHDQDLTKLDYKKVRELIEANNLLIKVYSEKLPDSYHISTLFKFMSLMAKKAYKVDKRVSSMEITNPKVKELQFKLSYSLRRAVFKSSPKLTLSLILIISLAVSLFKAIFTIKKASKSFYDWYIELVKGMFKDEYHLKYSFVKQQQ